MNYWGTWKVVKVASHVKLLYFFLKTFKALNSRVLSVSSSLCVKFMPMIGNRDHQVKFILFLRRGPICRVNFATFHSITSKLTHQRSEFFQVLSKKSNCFCVCNN